MENHQGAGELKTRANGNQVGVTHVNGQVRLPRPGSEGPTLEHLRLPRPRQA